VNVASKKGRDGFVGGSCSIFIYPARPPYRWNHAQFAVGEVCTFKKVGARGCASRLSLSAGGG